MENDRMAYFILLGIYCILLYIILFPYSYSIGHKPVWCLMLVAHVIYISGIFAILYPLFFTYHVLRNTEFGETMERSIFHSNGSTLIPQNDSFIYSYKGEDILFECKSNVVTKQNFVRWTFNDNHIEKDSRHLIFNDNFEQVNGSKTFIKSTLQVLSLTKSDFGVYKCLLIENAVDMSLVKNSQQKSCSSLNLQIFKLKRIPERTEVIYLPPGGILRLQLKYHFIPSKDAQVTFLYTINDRPITLHNDRQLYRMCSFFVYNYWLLFEYGYYLFQLNNTYLAGNNPNTHNLEVQTNFCVNEEFYGTYRFFVQKLYSYNSFKNNALTDIKYPVTFQILPRGYELPGSRLFTVFPRNAIVTNKTRQCWIEPKYRLESYCTDLLDAFKSVPILFFTFEGIIFAILFGIFYKFIHLFVYLLNMLLVFVVRDCLQLDHHFQVIRTVGRTTLSSKQMCSTNPNGFTDEIVECGMVDRQIFVSFCETDRKVGEKIKKDLQGIILSKRISNLTVKSVDDIPAYASIFLGLEELLTSSNAFLIYATENYLIEKESERAYITDALSNKKVQNPNRLFLLRSGTNIPNLFVNPRMEMLWHRELTQTAKRVKLGEWVDGLLTLWNQTGEQICIQ